MAYVQLMYGPYMAYVLPIYGLYSRIFIYAKFSIFTSTPVFEHGMVVNYASFWSKFNFGGSDPDSCKSRDLNRRPGRPGSKTGVLVNILNLAYMKIR